MQRRLSVMFDISTPQVTNHCGRAAASAELQEQEQIRRSSELEQHIIRREEDAARKEELQEQRALSLHRQQATLQQEMDRLAMEQDELDANRRAFLLERICAADAELMTREKALMERADTFTKQQEDAACEKEAVHAVRQRMQSDGERLLAEREEWIKVLAEKRAELEAREALLAALELERLPGAAAEMATQTPAWPEAGWTIPSWCYALSLAIIFCALCFALVHYCMSFSGSVNWVFLVSRVEYAVRIFRTHTLQIVESFNPSTQIRVMMLHFARNFSEWKEAVCKNCASLMLELSDLAVTQFTALASSLVDYLAREMTLLTTLLTDLVRS